MNRILRAAVVTFFLAAAASFTAMEVSRESLAQNPYPGGCFANFGNEPQSCYQDGLPCGYHPRSYVNAGV